MTDSIDRTQRWRTLRETGLAVLALFTAAGTLVCCAIPIVLVSIAGLGAVVASVTGSFPILITLSQHKGWVFGLSGVMLAASVWSVWFRARVCPADPAVARWCAKFQSWNQRMVVVSAVLWSVGFIGAFLALPLRKALGV